MNKKQVPAEVVGFRSVQIYVVDDIEEMDGFRWHSVVNDHHSEDDFEPWEEDDCPF